MHPGIGPYYCETALAQATSFPIEPINTWTSLIPVVTGVLALLWLRRHEIHDTAAYILASLAVLTGVGSALWHGLRTGLMLTFDVLPGLAYFLVILLMWPYRLYNRWWAYACVVALFGAVQAAFLFVPTVSRGGPPATLFLVITIFAAVLLVLTYKRARAALPWGIVMVGAAALAATFRSIDLYTCTTLPFGTHFLWHTFLALAAYAGVRFLVWLKKARSGV